MNDTLEVKINAVVEDCIATAIRREIDEDAMPLFNSKELVLFIVQTLFQTIAAPFAIDAYQHVKELIVSKAVEQGVTITEEDSKKMFDDTFVLMTEAEVIDESWKYNWRPYEK